MSASRIQLHSSRRLDHPVVPQGVVGTASGPKAIRAGQKVLLVDGLEHLSQRRLHNLVFDSQIADWPRLAGRLRDVHRA